MLDAYIIRKIREDRERRESGAQPLRIEVPRPPPEPPWDERAGGEPKRDDTERG
ncbi:MAG: hypothetical protein RIT28_5159, partial [Pseudomonadota bacterium]